MGFYGAIVWLGIGIILGWFLGVYLFAYILAKQISEGELFMKWHGKWLAEKEPY